MRIIKFRGKREGKNDWIYFDLMQAILDEDGITGEFLEYKLNHETVGQFTGLHDKNGKEIYEGDIVSYNRIIQNYDDDDILNPRYYKTPQYETKSFKSEVKYMYNSFTIMDNSKWNDLQVIGNIYENPELLTD